MNYTDTEQTVVFNLLSSHDSPWRLKRGVKRAIKCIYRRQENMAYLNSMWNEKKAELEEISKNNPTCKRKSMLEAILRGIEFRKMDLTLSESEKYKIATDKPESKAYVDTIAKAAAEKYVLFRTRLADLWDGLIAGSKNLIGGFFVAYASAGVFGGYGYGSLPLYGGFILGALLTDRIANRKQNKVIGLCEETNERFARSFKSLEISSCEYMLDGAVKKPSKLMDDIVRIKEYLRLVPSSSAVAGLGGMDIMLYLTEQTYAYWILQGGVTTLIPEAAIFGGLYALSVGLTFKLLNRFDKALNRSKENLKAMDYVSCTLESKF